MSRPLDVNLCDALCAVQVDLMKLAKGVETPESELDGAVLTAISVTLAWCAGVRPSTEAEAGIHAMLDRAQERGARLRQAVFGQGVR